MLAELVAVANTIMTARMLQEREEARLRAMESQHYRDLQVVLIRRLHDWIDQLRASGFLRDYHIEPRHRHDTDGRYNDLTLELYDGRRLHYSISEDELRMEGPPALDRWLQAIERDLDHRRGFRFSRSGPMSAPPPRPRFDEVRMLPGGVTWVDDFAAIQRHITPGTEKADRKAAELFKSVAGVEAYKALESGAALPVMGSAGGAYRLHKRSTYCISRQKDGAELCAVVPGVPLYDHLLGIKLMIEHDEPRFIRTANVSRGFSNFDAYAVAHAAITGSFVA